MGIDLQRGPSVLMELLHQHMTVSRVKSEHGESFSHCVNGVDVFAMGMDYIPEDNLLPRVTPERTRRLLYWNILM